MKTRIQELEEDLANGSDQTFSAKEKKALEAQLAKVEFNLTFAWEEKDQALEREHSAWVLQKKIEQEAQSARTELERETSQAVILENENKEFTVFIKNLSSYNTRLYNENTNLKRTSGHRRRQLHPLSLD